MLKKNNRNKEFKERDFLKKEENIYFHLWVDIKIFT